MTIYGTLGGQDSTTTGYPSIRPTLDLNFAATKVLDPRVTFYRNSLATYVDSQGIIRTVFAHVPRFDHDPTTGESLGLLMEESRTNLIISSSIFNTGGWTQDGISITNNAAVAPDGTTTATSIVQGTGNSRTFHFDNNGAGNKIFTIFAKSNAGSTLLIGGNAGYGTNSAASVTLNTSNGTATTATGITSVLFPNGWYRFTIPVYIGAGSGNSNYISIYGSTNSVYIWGAQLESNSFPTSYIPTTTSIVNRNADTAYMSGTNLTSWYNTLESTMFIQSRNAYNSSAFSHAGSGIELHSGSGVFQSQMRSFILSSWTIRNL